MKSPWIYKSYEELKEMLDSGDTTDFNKLKEDGYIWDVYPSDKKAELVDIVFADLDLTELIISFASAIDKPEVGDDFIPVGLFCRLLTKRMKM